MFSVILADDEPYILQGLERRIPWTELGYEVIGKAGNGLDCLDMVRKKRPDILITDIRMPGITGLDLLERIRQLTAPPRVIYISGYSEFEYARRALELGATAYLLKPIEKQVLVDALERARMSIEQEQQENRSRSERSTRKTLDFLHDLSSGTENRIILDRLGLEGRYDGYLCIVTEPVSGTDSLLRKRDFTGDAVPMPMGENCTIWILNLPSDRLEIVIRSLLRKGTEERSAGISRAGRNPHEISELIRQARIASLNGFSSGKRGTFRYESAESTVLTELMPDFESLLISGDQARIRRLLEQVREICTVQQPSVEAVLEFFNLFIALLGRIHHEKARNMPQLSLISDCDQLTTRFQNAGRMIEYLHEAVHDHIISGTHNSPPDAFPGDVTAAVRKYIRNHLSADLTLDTLSELLKLDKNQLGSILRSETEKTFAEHVREIRIEHACFLLRNTRLTVQEIATICGYEDYFYFAKLFRRERGITATDFRKQGLPSE